MLGFGDKNKRKFADPEPTSKETIENLQRTVKDYDPERHIPDVEQVNDLDFKYLPTCSSNCSPFNGHGVSCSNARLSNVFVTIPQSLPVPNFTEEDQPKKSGYTAEEVVDMHIKAVREATDKYLKTCEVEKQASLNLGLRIEHVSDAEHTLDVARKDKEDAAMTVEQARKNRLSAEQQLLVKIPSYNK